ATTHMQLPSRARLSLGLGVLVVALAGNALITYRNIRTLAANNARVAESTSALADLEEVLSTLKDAETGQRGYLLTGDPTYRAPYDRGAEVVGGRLAALRRLAQGDPAAGDPAAADRLAVLERDVAAKLAELKRSVDLHRGGDGAAALGVVKTG